MNWKRLFLVAILGALLCGPSWADLVGTSVTGSLTFGGNPLNFFDPVNGFVPNGPLNKTQGTTVAISSAIEFGFADGLNTDTADFTGTQLTLTDNSGGGQGPAVFTFTDAAFAGLTLSQVSNTFPGGLTASLVGTTLTIRSVNYTQSGTFQAVFDLTGGTPPIPEPGSIALLLSGVCAIGYAVRKRQR